MSIKKRPYLLLIIVMLSVTSCYTYRDSGLLQERSSLPEYETVSYEDYRIQINDEIIYRLITIDESISKIISPGSGAGGQNILSYRVYPDGTIDLPFVSKISVLGLTIDEAETVVQERMRSLIPDATVKLTLSNKTFTVIGQIGSGLYPIYKEKMTIFQALALSGDLTEAGDRRHVRILRNTEEGMKTLEFDIRSSSIIGSEYYYIYPNDIIYVQKSRSSFYKVNNYGSFLGLISTSISLLVTVLYFSR